MTLVGCEILRLPTFKVLCVGQNYYRGRIRFLIYSITKLCKISEKVSAFILFILRTHERKVILMAPLQLLWNEIALVEMWLALLWVVVLAHRMKFHASARLLERLQVAKKRRHLIWSFCLCIVIWDSPQTHKQSRHELSSVESNYVIKGSLTNSNVVQLYSVTTGKCNLNIQRNASEI